MADSQRSGNDDGERLWHRLQLFAVPISSRCPATRAPAACTWSYTLAPTEPSREGRIHDRDRRDLLRQAVYQGLHDDRSVADSLVA
jgi:hypothetical protein